MMEPLPQVDDFELQFIDTETTGRSAKKAIMMEAFCMRCNGPSLTAAAYLHTMCNPGIPCPAQARRVHKIEDWMVAHAPKEPEVCSMLHQWLSDAEKYIIVGHNIRRYDMNIISRHGFTYSNKIIDTMEMAKSAFPGKPVNQPALIKHFDLDLGGQGEAHRARYDVMMNRLIYLRLRKFVNPSEFIKQPKKDNK